MPRYKISRYASSLPLADGKGFALFSGLTGALMTSAQSLESLRPTTACETGLQRSLIQGMFFVPESLNEEAYVEERYQWVRHRSSYLGIIILPTYRCNLKCSYCYEVAQKGDMTNQVEDDLIAFVEQRLDRNSGFKGLEVSWFGGEPLLAVERILSVSKRLQSLCKSRAITYRSSLVTNGTLLTRENLRELREFNLTHIQVTLDGPKDEHDARRAFRGSHASSFDATIAGIEAAFGQVTVTIRMNIDKSNYGCIEGLLVYLRQKGWFPDPENSPVKLVFAYTSNFSGITCRNLCSQCYDSREFFDVEYELNKLMVASKMGFLPYPHPTPLVCSAVNVDAFIVDPRGMLYKCHLDVGQDDRSFGTLTSPQNILNDNFHKWYTYNPCRNDKCQKCEHLPICMGGCPAESMAASSGGGELCGRWHYLLPEYLLSHAEGAGSGE